MSGNSPSLISPPVIPSEVIESFSLSFWNEVIESFPRHSGTSLSEYRILSLLSFWNKGNARSDRILFQILSTTFCHRQKISHLPKANISQNRRFYITCNANIPCEATFSHSCHSGTRATPAVIESFQSLLSSIYSALSIYKMPSKWSNSWQIARAKNSFACKAFRSPLRS